MPWAGKWTFAAPLIRGAITRLQTDLPAAVAAFNGQPENTVALTVPVAYHFGAADPLILVNGPVVEVSIPAGDTGNASLDRVDVDHNLRLNVCAWHEGARADLEATYEMSLGLARCIIEVLTPDAAIAPEVEVSSEQGIEWRCDVLPEDPTDDGREFRKWRVPVLIQFRLEAVERFQP